MDIIVVGAGIAGLLRAWALAKAGHRVIVLEQGSIPNPLAASGDHHRIIRRAYGKMAGYGRLISEAYDAWDEMWIDLGERHLDPRGFLCVSREAGDEAEQFRDGMLEGGWPIDVMDVAAAAKRWPFLSPDEIRYVFYSADGGALHCRRIAQGLAAWLRQNGADLRSGCKAVAVNAAAGLVTLESGEAIFADRVIVCAGAWTTKLFPDLQQRLATYRTALAYVDPPADLRRQWETAPVILDIGCNVDCYMNPFSEGAGMKFGSGLINARTDDADANREPAVGEGEAIRDIFTPVIARISQYSITEVVTCAYTFTEDEKFAVYEKGKCLVISACSGHGYKFGAAVGRRAAQCVTSGDLDRVRTWLRSEL